MGYNKLTGAIAKVGALLIKSGSANALTAGPNGTTNPAFNVDSSAASAATGVNVAAAAAGAGVALAAISSGTNEALKVDGKGAGQVLLGSVSTGLVVVGRGANQQPVRSNALASLAGTNQTLTAAQLLGGVVEHAPTGAATDTTDTGTNLDAAIAGVAVGDVFTSTLVNTSAGANAITLAGGTGVTLKGTATTVGQNKTAVLTFRRTAAATWTCYVTVSA